MFLPESPVERIAVVDAVADHASWIGSREALLDGKGHCGIISMGAARRYAPVIKGIKRIFGAA